MNSNKIIKSESLKNRTKIYRYISLSQFMSFVETNQICLTKIKAWEDTWEAPTSCIPTEGKNGYLEYPSHTICDDMYGQCWSLNGDSDALWRIYSSGNEGIVIETSIEKFNLIHDIKLGMIAPVIYYEKLQTGFKILKSKKDYQNIFAEGFLKRKAFEHEKEIRLITLNNKKCIDTKYVNSKFIKLELDPTKFIEGIKIDPRARDWYVDTIKRYCNRVGFKFDPLKSNLYSSDIFKATGLVQKHTSIKNLTYEKKI
ncbi:DUF2971 domain-containing protein [Clostridium aestuarii]|uniref:DUF2971 domain-containing protein n=1 Tax=Clostridium aestuarii TaxID=338193 RepID=A0ABT4CX10_9CLOT|nr:DUF2971 domain-containing protein [Clostridium aestuarii]MCY6483531.1 DUF2971 domain-containing protein [Clostridium aestuarii]